MKIQETIYRCSCGNYEKEKNSWIIINEVNIFVCEDCLKKLSQLCIKRLGEIEDLKYDKICSEDKYCGCKECCEIYGG